MKAKARNCGAMYEAWTHRNALSSETFFASSGSDIAVSVNLSLVSSCKLSATHADEAAAIALLLPVKFCKASLHAASCHCCQCLLPCIYAALLRLAQFRGLQFLQTMEPYARSKKPRQPTRRNHSGSLDLRAAEAIGHRVQAEVSKRGQGHKHPCARGFDLPNRKLSAELAIPICSGPPLILAIS